MAPSTPHPTPAGGRAPTVRRQSAGDRAAAARVRTRDAGRAAEEIGAVLQAYADRGVFRGLSTRTMRDGGRYFRFTWLTREPITLTWSPASASLTFRDLLPGVARASPLLAEVQGLVASHSSRSVPSHRRVDPRRVTTSCAMGRGGMSVVLRVRGRHHAYAVQRGVNLVNDIFTLLHSSFPDYLWDRFGLPAE